MSGQFGSDLSGEPVVSEEPFDRLTHLSVEMTEPLDRPENADVRAIIFLGDSQKGGIQLHGYEDQAEAMVDLFVHVKAIFASMGKELAFIGVPESPQGLEDSPG